MVPALHVQRIGLVEMAGAGGPTQHAPAHLLLRRREMLRGAGAAAPAKWTCPSSPGANNNYCQNGCANANPSNHRSPRDLVAAKGAAMKQIFLLLASLLTLSLANASAAAEPACPELRVRITSVELTPQQPAQQHIVKVAWAASAPPCYTLNNFNLRGVITFANGQTKSFAQSVAGNQTSVQIQVPGLATNTTPSLAQPGMIPRSVKVGLSAEASATIAGAAGNLNTASPSEGDVVSAPPTSCLPLVQIQNVQAVFAGLVFSPENPNGTHFPKVKVSWQVYALPPCYRIEKFTVSALLRGTGGTRSKTVTVSGNQTATEIVFGNFPVAVNFTAGLILANVRASGTAKITGSDQRELQLN